MTKNIDLYIAALADYAVEKGLLHEDDRIFAINRILDRLALHEFTEPKEKLVGESLENILKALLDYGYVDEARELAQRTVKLFGEGLIKHGDMHEYYHPDTGEGVHNISFQSWNLLVNNMLAWLEGREVVTEF